MFNVLYDKMAGGDPLDEADAKAYTIHKNALRTHTLSIANAIVTTVTNSGDAALYSVFNPCLVVIDEATRAVEPDMWNILGHYPSAALLMVGDEAQLPPVVLSDNKDNGFSSPLRMSLFLRLKLLGIPSVLLHEQYRMVEDIGSMVSNVFYHGQLTNGPGTKLQDRSLLQDIAEYFDTAYGVKSPLLLLDVDGTTSHDANKLRYNSRSASAALNLGLDMIRKGVLQPGQLLIMTSYWAQYTLYRSAVRTLALNKPRMADIQVSTVDSMQGREAEFIIFDFVATEKIGFLRLRNRINVACSRAMDGMVILGSVNKILKEKEARRRHLGNIFNYLKARRLFKLAINTATNKHLPISLAHADVDLVFAARSEANNGQQAAQTGLAVATGFVEEIDGANWKLEVLPAIEGGEDLNRQVVQLPIKGGKGQWCKQADNEQGQRWE